LPDRLPSGPVSTGVSRAVGILAIDCATVLAVLALCGLRSGGIGWFATGIIMSMDVPVVNVWVS
jgi:hypothetical protein